MVKHKIIWRNAGEIPPGFLQEVLQLIMEKNEKCFFYLYKHYIKRFTDYLWQYPLNVV